jgi:hypothetical protein
MTARRILAATSSAATVLALATAAHGATVATVPCVPFQSGVKNMPITATGFTPGSLVTVKAAPKGTPTPSYLASGTADATGTFSTTAYPPSFNPFSRNLQTFGIVATDNINPALIAYALYQQVRPGYDFNPSSGRPTRIVTHTARGFTPGKNTYLHVRFGGRTIRNVKLGRATAPCGVVSRRLPLLPARSRRGNWTLYVDQKKTFSPSTRPQARSGLRISTVFR